MCNKLLSTEQGLEVAERNRKLCAELAPDAVALIAGFGIPEHLISAPIAKDWVRKLYQTLPYITRRDV